MNRSICLLLTAFTLGAVACGLPAGENGTVSAADAPRSYGLGRVRDREKRLPLATAALAACRMLVVEKNRVLPAGQEVTARLQGPLLRPDMSGELLTETTPPTYRNVSYNPPRYITRTDTSYDPPRMYSEEVYERVIDQPGYTAYLFNCKGDQMGYVVQADPQGNDVQVANGGDVPPDGTQATAGGSGDPSSATDDGNPGAPASDDGQNDPPPSDNQDGGAPQGARQGGAAGQHGVR